MLRLLGVLLLLQSAPPAAPPDEINDAVAHAEILYETAHFDEAIALLTRIESVLKAQSGRLKDKLQTKLQLALNNIGINQTAKAKTFFMALYALDPDYALDGEGFPAKVIAVAADAKTEQNKMWCFDAQTNARKYLDDGQMTAFLNLMESSGEKFPVLGAMTPEAAEIFYRSGLASYKRGEFSDALSSFETALTLSPEHDMARQYAALAHEQLQLAEEIRALTEKIRQ